MCIFNNVKKDMFCELYMYECIPMIHFSNIKKSIILRPKREKGDMIYVHLIAILILRYQIIIVIVVLHIIIVTLR